MPTFLPIDDSDTEYTFLPDLVVMDVGYTYTGLRDHRGHKILRRVSRPVGFIHHGPQREYVTEADEDSKPAPAAPERDDDYIHEGEGLEW